MLYDGLVDINHRAQKYAGFTTNSETEGVERAEIRAGTVTKNFDYDLMGFKGNYGIGHVSAKDRQPRTKEGKLGKFGIVYSGNILNYDFLRSEFLDEGHTFNAGKEDLDVLIALLFKKGADYVSGIKNINDRIKGSYTLGILTEKGIFVARDPSGYRPLVIGKRISDQKERKDNIVGYAVSSESSSFEHIGFEILRDVKPGEILFFNHEELKTLDTLEGKIQYCAFEWVYTANINSIIDGLHVAAVRENIGTELAKQDKSKNLTIDLVAPIPMSGIGHAKGYHLESGIPQLDVFAYNRYLDRSYTPDEQWLRDLIAEHKLFSIDYNIRGKSIIIVDDSIVRGTQIKKLVKILKTKGAKEVHVRIGSPPLTKPCPYTKATRKKEELATNKRAAKTIEDYIDKMRIYLDADSLDFIRKEVFFECFYNKNTGFKIPREQLCWYCWT